MNRLFSKIASFMLAFLVAFSVVPSISFSADAALMTISAMQKKYPDGKYWNSPDPESYTSTPCTHHVGLCSYDGSCGCSTYKNYAIQCMGFAFQLAYTAYGGEPYLEWEVEYDVETALKNLKPGDVIRYNFNGHSAFVYGVSGDTVTFADCNYGDDCVIRWGGTITKTQLRETFSSVAKAPYSLAKNHTHKYSTSYDEAHPHMEYKKCSSCGYHYYTGEKKMVSGCGECSGTTDTAVLHPLPIKAIPLSGKNTTAYKEVKGEKKSRKIDGDGICYIQELYSNGWCRLDYTDTNGEMQTGYAKASKFFNPTYPLFKFTASKKILTYARGDLKEEIGYTVAGDTSYVVDHNSKAVQILYPISGGGYRAAWIARSDLSYKISYNANGGKGSMTGLSVNYQDTFTLLDNKFTKTGYTADGWNLWRSTDNTWYCEYIVPKTGEGFELDIYSYTVGWKTEEEMKAGGYTKAPFNNNHKSTLDMFLLENSTVGDEFVFYPIWQRNTVTVYYNANGGETTSDEYTLKNNGMIYSTKDGEKFSQTWKYNLKRDKGLTNYTTFDLQKEGYVFRGWSNTPEGSVIFNQDSKNIKPTDLNPKVKKSSCYTVLYAIWEKEETANVKEISVATEPKKVIYGIGEAFSTSGMTLKVVFEDGKTETVNKGFTVSGYHPETAGRKILTVSFGGAETYLNVAVSKKPKVAVRNPSFFDCTHKKLSLTSTTAATCEDAGEKLYTCDTCSATKSKILPKVTHQVAITPAVAPTCTKKGKQEGLHCSDCEAVVEKGASIKKTSHTYKEKVTLKATTEKNGTLTKTCTVCKKKKTSTIKKIKSLQLSRTTYLYSGKTRKPSVTVKNSEGEKLKKGTDYTLKYESGRKAVGEYKVTVSFRGKYTGKSYLYFKIRPKATSINTVTAKEKSLTVTWKKQTKKTTGYQLEYSTSKTFKAKYSKKVTVSKTKTTSKTLKNLKTKKTYYIRIRTYKKVNGKRIYSSWSDVVKKKTK